jgi:hypothetical protein
MISVQEFGNRLGTLRSAPVTSDDIEDLADAAGVRIDPARGIDAGQAQQLLDHVTPAVQVSGAAIVAAVWPPPQDARPAVAPVAFSSPGAFDAPADAPQRPRRSGPGRTGRPGGSPRSGGSRRSGR